MNDAVMVSIERKTRNELAELKKNLTYNSIIRILLKRNRILKQALKEKYSIRENMEKNYKDLFNDEEFTPLLLIK
ncbi:hypothetical protein LCGC14_1359990 [marine sediment metagenome]|uniref:Uncharacterized protein n=1 Tax=marine sediment metagenome TaxID=412755 RepID=A0A0F9KUF6_9ZZZZ